MNTEELTKELRALYPPLEGDQTAKFQLIGAGQKTAGSDRPVYPELQINAWAKVYDYFDAPNRREKILEYKDDENTYRKIRFDANSAVTITAEDPPELYYILMCNDYNISYPYRRKKSPAIWETVKSRQDVEMDEEQLFDIQNEVYRILNDSDDDTIKTIAMSMGIGIDQNLKQIKIALNNKARENVKNFVERLPNKEQFQNTRMKLMIYKALDLGLIKYDSSLEKWIHTDGQDNKKYQICARKNGQEGLAPLEILYDGLIPQEGDETKKRGKTGETELEFKEYHYNRIYQAINKIDKL